MTCHDVETRGMAEEYLLGRLSEADAEAYESHYFSCERCYSELSSLRAVRSALTGGSAAAAAPRQAPRTGTRALPWLAAAAAVILAVAVSLVIMRRGSGSAGPIVADSSGRSSPAGLPAAAPAISVPEPTPTLLAEFCRFDPPPY